MVKISVSTEFLSDLAAEGDVRKLGQMVDSPLYDTISKSHCLFYLPTAVKAAIELGRDDVYPMIGELRGLESLSEGMVAMLFNYAASLDGHKRGQHPMDEQGRALLFAYMYSTLMDEMDRFNKRRCEEDAPQGQPEARQKMSDLSARLRREKMPKRSDPSGKKKGFSG
jgi:hypothetical protein